MPRASLVRDAVAGLVVAGVLLPESVAYAAIAGVPAAHAFIAALCGLLVYAALGRSRYAIVATTSSAAAVFATAVAAGGPAQGFVLVLATGGLFVLASTVNAGFLANFISRPVLRGFAWGLAVTIVLKQVPHLIGLDAHGGGVPALLLAIVRKIGAFDPASVITGGCALLTWLLLRHVVRRFVYLPPSLIVLALGVLWARLGGENWLPVALVGHVEWHDITPTVPMTDLQGWIHAMQLAPALMLILFAESWGAVRSLALESNETLDARRELGALGAANLVCACLQGLPVGAGFSAAVANHTAGASSRLAGLVAALLLALLLWVGRGWLAWLPVPVLSAVMIAILSHNLWPRSVIESLKLGSDAWLAFVAAASVLVFGVLAGMLVAVGLSLLLAMRRFARPMVAEIARVPGSHDFVDRARHESLEAPPQGMLLMRPEEPMFFANAEAILGVVSERATRYSARVVVLSLEMCDDFDSTTVEAIGEFATRMERDGRTLLFARLKDEARNRLREAGLDHARGAAALPSEGRMFWSVDDAWRHGRDLLARTT